MVQFKPPKHPSAERWPEPLPTEHDLPDSDGRPVDNELQLLIPILLRGILELAWSDRPNWFLGANMGVYYDPTKPAIGPDGFLCLGVPHYREGKDLRLSYLLWQEKVTPQWVLEIVSQTPGKEYDEKMAIYAAMGVLYYTIYNPKYAKRDKHDVFEVYRLVEGEYVRQSGHPVWMPEVGLGIGVARGKEGSLPVRNWLYWYDEQGNQYATKDLTINQLRSRLTRAELTAEQEKQSADQAKQEADQAKQEADQMRAEMDNLRQKMRDRNIDPDSL